MRALPRVVDGDILLRKGLAIEHHGSRVRAKLPLDAAELASDESLRNDLCFDLLQALQAVIDLSMHTCAHEALGVPDGPASAFSLLARNAIITSALAARLSAAAGLRNLIVHQYAELDVGRLVAAVEGGMGDLDAFVRSLRAHARAPGAD